MNMSDTGSIEKTPQRRRRSKKADKNDPSRFQDAGINFKAKLIGVDDVPDARGDKMCQESIQRLKGQVKSSGEHKQKIVVNVSVDGLKIIDEKTGNEDHCHAVHKISFISRDTTDARAFGYVYGPGGGTHKFFAIKTEKAAEGLVLTLRDLFQVVFELKKKEVDEAKNKKNADENVENTEKEESKEKEGEIPISEKKKEADTANVKIDDSTSNMSNASSAVQEEPKSSGTGNLLDLENELVTIQEGINQMNAFGDTISTASDSQSEGCATPSPWGKPEGWGFPNESQTNTTAFQQQPFAAFGQQPAAVQQQAANTAAPFAANFGQNTTTQPVSNQVLHSSSSSSRLQELGAMNAFSSTQSQPFSSTANSLFANNNTSPFMSSPAFGGMSTGSSPPPVQSGVSSPWTIQNAGTGINNVFSNNINAPVSPPPASTQFAAFGSSVTPPSINQNSARLQTDPFKNDPFFTNSTPANTQMNNPFAAPTSGLGTVSPASGFGTVSSNNGFGTVSPANGFGTVSSTNGFGTVSPANGFGTVSPANGFGTVSSTNGFGTVSPASGFGSVSPANGVGTVSSANGFGTVSPANRFGTVSPASGFGSVSPANGFGTVSPVSSFGTVSPAINQVTSASSPFGTIGTGTATSADTGSANPFEMLVPQSSNNTKQPAANQVDPFGDLCMIGSGISKEDFFKDANEKPTLASLKVGDDDSVVNADSGRGDSSSSPATSIEWATPPSKHRPTTITNTTTGILSPPDINEFNLPSPAAPPPPLPSIPGLQFTYASPPPPPPRPGARKQSSITATVTSTSVTASTTVTVSTVQSHFTTPTSFVSSGGVKVSRDSPVRRVERSSHNSSMSSTQSPIIPRPRSKSSQLKSQTSLQFMTDPFAEAWQWPDDPAKNDPFTSDPFNSPLDPFGSFTKAADPFSTESKSDPFGSELETKPGALNQSETATDTFANSASSLKSHHQPMKKDSDSDSDPFAFVANKNFTKNEPSRNSESDRPKDTAESDPFKIQTFPTSSKTNDSPSLSVNTDIASGSDPFASAFNPFSNTSTSAASSPDPFVVSTHQSPLRPKMVKQTSLNPFAPPADITVEKVAHNTCTVTDSSSEKRVPFIVDLFVARSQVPEVTSTDPFLTDSFFSGKSAPSSAADPFAAFDPFNLNPAVVKDTHPAAVTSQTTDASFHCAASSSSSETHNTARSNLHTASTSLSDPFDTRSVTETATQSCAVTSHFASFESTENQKSDSKASLKLVNPDPFDMFRPQDSEC